MLRHRQAGRLIAFLLACDLTACTVWRVQDEPPGEVLSQPQKQVRITRMNGEQTELESATVVGDSLVSYRPRSSQEPVTVSVDDIRSVELKEVSWPRVILFGVGGGVVGVVALAYLLLATDDSLAD